MNINKLTYLQKSWLLIFAFSCTRIMLSGSTDLGNDESYYWTYSQQLQWNYFDHPPLVAVWIRLFTLNLWLQDHVFFIRLGSIVGCAVSAYFIYKTIAAISTAKAGFTGVLLYNTSFYATITAGLFIMPDTPQMVFWTGSMYMITKIFAAEKNWWPWLLFGISTGLCIMSKVHGIFLWAGIFLYALLYARRFFLLPQFYVAALITAVIISPILLWNIENDFITYHFHSKRVIVKTEDVVHWFGLLKELIGELIINNPFNVIMILVFLCFKKFTGKHLPALHVFKFIALPLLLIIFAIALFRHALPHWSGPVYVTLIPFAAIGLTGISAAWYKRMVRLNVIYTLVFMIAVAAAINLYPGTFGNKSNTLLGDDDLTLDNYGWQQAGEKFTALYKSTIADTTLQKPPLVCNTWWGAHQEYYFARPAGTTMIGLGPANLVHNYTWRNKKVLNHVNMDTAFCVVHSADFYDAPKTYADYYNNIDFLTTIVIARNKKPAHKFYVYRLSGWKHQALSISPFTNSISTLILSGLKSNVNPAVSKS